MKKYFLFLLLTLPSLSNGQNKNYLGMHILPLATSETRYATGIYFDYNRVFRNNYFFKIGYGIIYDNYWQPQYEYDLAGGGTKWSNDIFANDIPFPNAYKFPSQAVIDDLNTSGFKNLNTDGSYRLDHFLNLNFGYNLKFGKSEKWSIAPSAGILLGLADITFAAGAADVILLKNIEEAHPLYPAETYLNIVFQVRNRYLYFGYNIKVDLDRKISDRFSLGMSSGINFSVRKDFSGEQQFLFTGVNAKAYF